MSDSASSFPIDVHRVNASSAKQIDAMYKMGKKGGSTMAGASAAAANSGAIPLQQRLQGLLSGGDGKKGKEREKPKKEEYIKFTEKELKTMASVNPNYKEPPKAKGSGVPTSADPLKENRRMVATINLMRKRFPDDEFIQKQKVPPITTDSKIIYSILNGIREHLNSKGAEDQVEKLPFALAWCAEQVGPRIGLDLEGFSAAMASPEAEEQLADENNQAVAELAPYCNFPLWIRYARKFATMSLEWHYHNRLQKLRYGKAPENLVSAAADL